MAGGQPAVVAKNTLEPFGDETVMAGSVIEPGC
jgi:hypothetical protein